MVWILLFLIASFGFSQELTLERVLRDTLEKNLEIKALKHELRSYEREYLSARANLFPNLKLEENFTRTDIPAFVLFTKLNQERVQPADFTPSSLNDPDAVSNFETKLSIEIPLWMGGKIRAYRDIALLKKRAQKKTTDRKEEEILFKAYEAFLRASLSRSAISVAKKNVEDAREHLRLAQKLRKVGMALLSDVLRAQVFLSKAEEALTEAQNNYEISLKALGLVANTDYTGMEVPELKECPQLNREELRRRALERREDLKAMEDYIRVMRKSYRASLSGILPQIVAFASYSLYDINTPLGSDGKGYIFGFSLTLSFNTGLSDIHKARSFKDKERALVSRKEFLKRAILFGIDKAYSEYETALRSLKSARARVRSAEEVVRIVGKRYESGLARMVDLLDAQTQLENARLDYIQALYRCNLSYAKALLEAGLIKEVLR